MKKHILFSICFLFIVLLSNAQNGIAWDGMSMDIANNSHDNMHPRIALDGSENPLVVWGRMSDEAVFFSRWNGSAFTAPVKLNPSWLTVASASWMGPDIASKGDTVYVVVKRTPETSDTNYVYIMSSFNGGVSFAPPVRVDFIGDSISRFPTVTVDAIGNPIVAFMKFNSSFLDSRWVIAKSTDFGASFSPDVKASGYSGMNAEVCDCCPGAIVSSGNVSTMLYRDNNSNIRDIWTGVSTNNAISFPSGFEVDDNNWMIMSCPSSGPDGVIVGDTLYSTFMSSGSGNARTYLSKSSISDGTANSVANLTGAITGLTQQNYPRIASNGSAMAVVWKQNVSGTAQLPILFTNNIANGFPADYDTVDLADITNTDVALSNGKVWAVWQDDNAGTVKYRSGTYTPLGTSIDETKADKFSVFPNPASDILNIVPLNEGKYGLAIYNAFGQQVFSSQLTTTKQLDISRFSGGMYHIQITQGNNSHTQTFIKQ
ncbi:MAG: T9SS type A sorting domain-containing protein [Sphingobacteriales bacterium JAD_PAG50586_3]|nr:MAG: T9SS type A sorting domain-containing protein [Sphingobacteriales bacterium JAD_PAG50586_3]